VPDLEVKQRFRIKQHELPKDTVRTKKNAIKDSNETVHNVHVHCKLQGKNAIIPIIIYLNKVFQDSTNA
jgi:hypothetical protein